MTAGGAARSQGKAGTRERVIITLSLVFFRLFGPLIRWAIRRGIAGPTSS